MLISHKHKFIFIKNTKTGSSSIQTLFGKYCWPDHLEYPYIDHDFMEDAAIVPDKTIRETFKQNKENHNGIIGTGAGSKWTSHLTATEIKEYIGDFIFDAYFKFCVVRNPYIKVLSKYFYQMHAHKGQPFAEWVAKPLEKGGSGEARNLPLHRLSTRDIPAIPHMAVRHDQLYSCDYYARYEDLDRELETVCKLIGLPAPDFNKIPQNKNLNSPEEKQAF